MFFSCLSQESEEGSGDGQLGMSKQGPSHPDVIFEMLFTNFLFHAASPNMYMLYSTNYRVMESIAKVCWLVSCKHVLCILCTYFNPYVLFMLS